MGGNADTVGIVGEEDTEHNLQADPLEKIKKFKELFDIGAITEDEFQDKKRGLLGRI